MDNLSIHPRSWPHQRDSERKNTCSHKKRSTVQRAVSGLSRHAEQHPTCAVTASHLAKKLKALASTPADKIAQA